MPSYKSTGSLFAAAAFLAAMFHSSCTADIAVKREGGLDTVLSSMSVEGTAYAPLRGLCELLGFNCRWAKTAQKLTCVKGYDKIVVSEDIPVYYVNDSIRQLPCAPVREKSGLYLPAWLTVSILGGLAAERLDWNAGDSTITIGSVATVAADTSRITVREPEKTPETPAPRIKTAAPNERELVKNIVIDPGHGGKDPGALGPDGAKEKDIVLGVGLKLRDLLKKKNSFRFT